jgi:hypothetical protein
MAVEEKRRVDKDEDAIGYFSFLILLIFIYIILFIIFIVRSAEISDSLEQLRRYNSW